MKKSFLLLFLAALSLNVFAQELKVVNATGWEVTNTAKDKVIGRFFPGTTLILSKENDVPANQNEEPKPPVTVTVRKIKNAKIEMLKDRNEDWQNALWSPEEIRKRGFLNQRVIKVDGQARYIAELTFDAGLKVMARSAVMATVVDGELIKMQFDGNEVLYRAGTKQALDLLRTVKFETSPVAEAKAQPAN